MTKAVANYEDYPVTFYKTKSKLYRISLAPKKKTICLYRLLLQLTPDSVSKYGSVTSY